jgi:hypothetical protein
MAAGPKIPPVRPLLPPSAARHISDKAAISVRRRTRAEQRLFRSLDVLRLLVLTPCRRSDGEVPERSNGAVSKTVVLLAGDRGFESLPLRHLGSYPLKSVTPAKAGVQGQNGLARG